MSAFSSRCSECGALSSGPRSREEEFDASVATGTRHHALLKSNQPPEESELTFVQSVVLQADSSLDRLDGEISELQRKLQQLEAERASLFSYRMRNGAILSPLRRMPPEILREIFLRTLPSIDDALRLGRFDIGQSPWVLTQICSRWRAVSISTHSLWSRIAVDYSCSLSSLSTYSLPPVEVQLQRSQKLQIHFYATPNLDFHPQIQMLRLLLQHSSRWEELSIGLTAATAPLLAPLRDWIPSLTRLWIQWDCPEDQIGVQSLDCFQTASSLVDVGIFNEYRFVPILLPVNQLTRYEVDCPWEQHRRTLKQTPNLIEARIGIDFDDDDWPGSGETIDLLHLQRLYVSNAPVLGYLRAPALEELALNGTQHSALVSLCHSFLSRSSCRLRRLCLTCPTALPTVKILQSFSSITELFVINYDDYREEVNALMETLTVSNLPGSTTVAPHLRLMFFGCEDQDYFDYGVYLEMLKSRWTAERCALTAAALLVDDGPKPDSETLCGLDALRRDGLDLLLLQGAEATDEMNSWCFKTMWN